MTILNDAQTKVRAAVGLITPYDSNLQNGESYDLTIGDTIKLQRINWLKAIAEKLTKGVITAASAYWEEIDISGTTQDNPFWLKRNVPLLACSEQYLKMPPDLVAKGFLKSGRAREFLEHLQAVFIDATYEGVITLEHVNVSRTAMPIWKGMRVMQLTFEKTTPAAKPYKDRGHYHGDITVQESKGYFQ